jgi:hypothetical protein
MAVLVAALQMQQQPAEHLVKVMVVVSMAALAAFLPQAAVVALELQAAHQAQQLAAWVALVFHHLFLAQPHTTQVVVAAARAAVAAQT